MAAPTNISAATATEITELPTTIIQDNIDEAAAPNFEVWFTYTGRVGDALAIGVWAFAPIASNYDTVIDVFTGTPSVLVPITNFSSIGPDPFEPPSELGINYYYRVRQGNAGVTPNASLTFSMLQGPLSGVPVGSLLITDFGSEVPATTVDAGDGDILQFVDIPAADFGDNRANGVLGFINGDAPYVVSLYEASTLELIVATAGLTLSGNGNQIRKCDALGGFFVAKSASATNATVYFISDAGVVSGTTYSLPANSRNIRNMTPNLAGTVLYYSALGDNVIYAYDLPGAAALPNLVAAAAGFISGKDGVTLDDNTYLFMYKDTTTSPRDDRIRRYNSAGVLQNTYSVPTSENLDRINVDIDNDYFWYWTFATSGSDTVCRLRKILVADGSVAVTFDVPMFSAGINQGEVASDDMSRFGMSNSCPLIVLAAAIATPESPGSGIYVLDVTKHHDTLYVTYDPVTTEDVRIPTPRAKFSYVGGE